MRIRAEQRLFVALYIYIFVYLWSVSCISVSLNFGFPLPKPAQTFSTAGSGKRLVEVAGNSFFDPHDDAENVVRTGRAHLGNLEEP